MTSRGLMARFLAVCAACAACAVPRVQAQTAKELTEEHSHHHDMAAMSSSERRDGVRIAAPRPGSLGALVAAAAPGATVLVPAGTYREATLIIDKPLTLDGRGAAILDGSGAQTVVLITADDVTLRGLVVRNTGLSQSEDRAGIRVDSASRCRIEQVRAENNLFGIYLSRANGCVVRDNVVVGTGTAETAQGNGIQLWQSEGNEIARNHISRHRDGIYLEFAPRTNAHDNESTHNQRYGMHFMFSDDCRYERNVYRENGTGVAVMYSKRVVMQGNRFERNWGSAAYGLLLKDINDGEVRGNRFLGNSIGLYLEGANRNQVIANEFSRNGWALKLMANAQDNRFAENTFLANTFDVATNSRQNFSTFDGNYWDRYRGYDLNRDGHGDVPFAPVRLFTLVVEQAPVSLVLLHSILVDVLDLAERVLPALTPETLVDARPMMRLPAPTPAATPAAAAVAAGGSR